MSFDQRQTPLGAQRPRPNPGRRFVPLHLSKGRTPELFIVTSPALVGFHTHFLDGRIHPCTQSLGACLPCRQGYLARWRGFASALKHTSGARWVVQCTAKAWEENATLQQLDGKLTGTWWTIHRAGDSPQSRMIWTHCLRNELRAPTRAADVLDVLSNLWGIDLRALGARKAFDGDCRPLLQPYHKRRV